VAILSNFSENLRLQRQKKNLSQEELGNLIGVSGVTIMRYEKGTREPKLETIKKIANALKIPVSDLININSPIIDKATNRFISGKHPEEIETYGDIIDDIVMSSELGSTINNYQSAVAELNQLRLDMILLCYQALDEKGKENLCNYAKKLLKDAQNEQ
jgi:transcriptional regulator with XRE-family HTH domain